MRGRLRPIVTTVPAAGAEASGVAMVRQARLLRHRLKSKPAEMHRQLARLSSRHATTKSASSARIVSAVATSVAPGQRADVATVTAAFTSAVRQHVGLSTHPAAGRPLKSPLLLRYSQRLQLLRTGEEMGLSRFQANLVIAAVQHEARRDPNCSDLRMTPAVSTTALFLVTQAILITALAATFLVAGL